MRSKKQLFEYGKEAKRLIDLSGHDENGIPVDVQAEKRLLCAIVIRAIDDYRQQIKNQNGIINAGAWLVPQDEDPEEPFTFAWICEQLSTSQPEDLKKLFFKFTDGPKVPNIGLVPGYRDKEED